MPGIDLEKAQRESVRWYILTILNAGRPIGANEAIVQMALADASMQMTSKELRCELDYLRDRRLIEISGEDGPMWSAQLTALGVDIVEYTAECRPGIARPPKWPC